MEELYFPKALYVEAHHAYLAETGKSPIEVMEYSMNNPEFFVEVVFSYVDKMPYPKMKEVQ